MIYGVILCLGDSLTNGARSEYVRGYPEELADFLSEKFSQSWVCVNRGINGETSPELLKRAYSEMSSTGDAYEVIVLCGTNDAKETVATPLEMYKKNLEGIMRIAIVKKKKPYLCTIPQLMGFGAPDYTAWTAKRIKDYNNIVRELAKKYKTKLVELEQGVFQKEDYADGVHLNYAGYKKMALKIGGAILEERHWEESAPKK